MGHAKPQMPLTGIEVAVAVQQGVAVGESEGGDQAGDGFADCNTAALKSPIVT